MEITGDMAKFLANPLTFSSLDALIVDQKFKPSLQAQLRERSVRVFGSDKGLFDIITV